MADVFISYNKGSAEKLVRQIADALDAAGISCWYMGRDSRYGRFPEKIAEEIENCTVFLLVLNETSNKSKHVQNEVSLAFENDKELLLFHVDSCELSYYMRYYLNSFARMDANPPTEQRIEELVRQITDILRKKLSTQIREPNLHSRQYVDVICHYCGYITRVPFNSELRELASPVYCGQCMAPIQYIKQ